jgi:hypothetical protein
VHSRTSQYSRHRVLMQVITTLTSLTREIEG